MSAYRFGAILQAADHEQVLMLQASNLKTNVTTNEAREQGFVTVEHDLALLQEMGCPYPHTGAWDEQGQLVGYALVMEPHFRQRIPVLVPMFDLLDSIPYRSRKLATWRYFVMGQVCIDKAHRGQGVFAGLYQEMRQRLHSHFDLIVTEIATRNTRSRRAHEKVGFQDLLIYRGLEGEEWAVVALDIRALD